MIVKTNILHLRASNFYGGPERQIHRHALAGKLSDFLISIGSFTENGSTPEFINVISGDGISALTFNVASAYDPSAVSQIRKYLSKNDTRVLCTHDYRTHLIGFLATRGIKTKWIAFSRGYTAENLKIKLYHLLDKIIIRFADKIIAVSHSQKQKLVDLLIGEGKITVVHNAIDCHEFENLEKENLRTRFYLPDNSIIVVSGGRFSAEKGQAYLARAAARAVRQNDAVYFLMFGDGPDLGKIKNIIAASDCQDRVLCPGFEKEFLKCLKGADILVNPSLTEGLPNIVLEAMCLGVPVVATAVGGVPELIKDDYSGYLAPAKDIEFLAKRITDMAIDRKRAAHFAANALSTVKTSFTFDKQNQKLFELYRSILS